MRQLIALLALSLVSSGCATTLSSLQTARPVERGRVQAHMGFGVYAPVGQVIDAIALGAEEQQKLRDAAAAGEPYEIDGPTASRLTSAAIALGAFPPAASYELAIRTGILERDWDVGFRYSVNAVRLDTKYRLVHLESPGGRQPTQGDRFDLAVGLGAGRYLFSGPLFDALEFLKIDDFSRTDLEVPVYVSYEFGEIFKAYAVPKYVFARTSFDARLANFSQEVSVETGLDLTLPDRVDAHFFGSTLGLALGYRYVHLYLELTGGYTHCAPTLFGEARQLGGVTLYPALGLVANFGQES